MSNNVVPKLTPKQRAAIGALASGLSYRDAATAAGIHEKTLSRWRNLRHFRERLDVEVSSNYIDAQQRLTGGTSTCLDVLLSVMLDKDTPASVKVRASNSWLNHHQRYVELSEFERRISALEERL